MLPLLLVQVRKRSFWRSTFFFALRLIEIKEKLRKLLGGLAFTQVKHLGDLSGAGDALLNSTFYSIKNGNKEFR